MKKANTMNFMERIQKHPELQHRFDQLLSIVEDSAGDIQKASEAEQRVIEELQQMGNAALSAWGNQKVSHLSETYDQKEGCSRVGKKNSGGIRAMEKSP